MLTWSQFSGDLEQCEKYPHTQKIVVSRKRHIKH